MGRNRRAAAVLAIGALVGLTACGDDSDDVNSAGDASEITSAAAETTAGASEDTTAETTGEPDTTDSSGGGELDGDFCASTAQMMDDFENLDLDFGSGDFDQMSDTFGEMLDNLEQLADDAPEELQDDFATLTDGFDEVQNILPRLGEMMSDVLAAGTDQEKLAEVQEKYADLMESDTLAGLDSAEFEEAGQNITNYLTDVCGLDVGS